jgi:hypothetical protein
MENLCAFAEISLVQLTLVFDDRLSVVIHRRKQEAMSLKQALRQRPARKDIIASLMIGPVVKKTISSLSLLSILFMIIGGATACVSTGTPVDETAIRAYADPITDATLKGLSANSLSDYVKSGNAAFKAAVTQSVFDKAVSQINGQLGSYVSVSFLRGEEKDGYVIVHYKATYTKGDVGVRMIFDKDHLLAGQWFE